jgi:adenylate kinase
MQVVREAIAARPRDQKILFDGIPRDTDQMQSFDSIMKEVGREYRCVEILLSEEESINRILGRAQEEGRADDADESIVRRRMQTFHDKTMPVIQEYRERDMLMEVDGLGTVEEVYERLKKGLGL